MSEMYPSENQQPDATDMNQASKLTYFEPMTVGKILELSFKFFFRNFGLFFLITLLAFLPSFALSVATNFLGLGQFQAGDFDAVWLVLPLVFATMLVLFVSQTFATAGLVHAVSRIYLGKKTSVLQAFSAVRKRFWSLALAQTIVAIFAIIGTILCILPGIYVFVSFMIVVPAVMLEPIKGTDAIERTYGLINGYRWHAFFILLVLFLVGLGIGVALSAFLIPLMLMTDNPNSPVIQSLSGLAQTLSQSLSAPLGAIAATLLYYDMRIRKEGFDLELLEQSLGSDFNDPE